MKKFLVMIAASLAITACAKHAEDVSVAAKDGQNGSDGQSVQGPKGDKGDPGQSVKGDKGDKGDKGADGVGKNGKDGKDGVNASCKVVQLSNGLKVTCSDGSTATVTNTCDPSKPGPAGPPGPKGDKGDKGDPGKCQECEHDWNPCGKDFDAEYKVRRDLYGKLYFVDEDGKVIAKLTIGGYSVRSKSNHNHTCKIKVDCDDRVEDEKGNACAR